MIIDDYLTISRQLLELAYNLDDLYFNLKCLIPDSITTSKQRAIKMQATHQRSHLRRFTKQRQQLFDALTAKFTSTESTLHQPLIIALKNQMSEWQDHQTSYLANLRVFRQRLINRPQNLTATRTINLICNEISAEDSESIRKLALTLGASLIEDFPEYFQTQLPVDHLAQKLTQTHQYLFSLMNFQGQDHTNLPTNTIYRFLTWLYVGVLPNAITLYSARKALPDAQPTGLSATAVVLKFDNFTQALFVMRGTEFSPERQSDINPFSGWNKAFIEAYRDWRYNVQAILFGQDTEYSQFDVAYQFVKRVKARLPKNTKTFGIGHSLGGHLVQALQLVHHCFDGGFTLNAAPVQLRQIQKLAPNIFSTEIWDKLYLATINGGAKSSDPEFLANILGYKKYPIVNVGFNQDVIQTFYKMNFNVYVGKFNYLYKPTLHYPFVTDTANYLTKEEQDFAAFALGEFFRQTNDTDPNQSLRRQIVTFIHNWGNPPHLSPDKRAEYAHDYIRYLVACKILRPKLPTHQSRLPWNMRHYFSSNKLNIIRRLRPDMIELLIYFHVVPGARHFCQPPKF